MRTIKFRGKKLDNKEWVYGDLVHGQGYKEGKMFILPQTQYYPQGCHSLDGWDVDPDTVGQFSDLVDINRKEIYEGHRVNCNNVVVTESVLDAEVVFVMGAFRDNYNGYVLADAYRNIEIIGDIYSQPISTNP